MRVSIFTLKSHAMAMHVITDTKEKERTPRANEVQCRKSLHSLSRASRTIFIIRWIQFKLDVRLLCDFVCSRFMHLIMRARSRCTFHNKLLFLLWFIFFFYYYFSSYSHCSALFSSCIHSLAVTSIPTDAHCTALLTPIQWIWLLCGCFG